MSNMVGVIVVFIVALDQLTKYLALKSIPEGHSVQIIKNIFYLTLVKNTGAAFGIFKNQIALFIAISVATLAFIVFILRRAKNKDLLLEISLALILGGALGNLIDRIRYARVIDFFDFRVWPVFNIADSAITVGGFLLMYKIIKSR